MILHLVAKSISTILQAMHSKSRLSFMFPSIQVALAPIRVRDNRDGPSHQIFSKATLLFPVDRHISGKKWCGHWRNYRVFEATQIDGG